MTPLEPGHYTDGKLWADDVAAIIDDLGLDRPVLAGGWLRGQRAGHRHVGVRRAGGC